jgi:hypothetical protein
MGPKYVWSNICCMQTHYCTNYFVSTVCESNQRNVHYFCTHHIFVHSDDPRRLFQSARKHIYATDQLLWSNYSCAADTFGEFGEIVRYLTHEVQAHHCDLYFYPENYNNSRYGIGRRHNYLLDEFPLD